MYICVGLKARNRQKKEVTNSIERQEKALRDARKPYKPSKWANDMVRGIKRSTDNKGNFNPSGCLIAELDKKGAFRKVPKNAKQDVDNALKNRNLTGGFGKE